MEANGVLHITNGSHLTDYLKELQIEGTFLTWHEMLCEGPTIEHINSTDFLTIRTRFLKEFYQLEVDKNLVLKEIKILDDIASFKEIVLWFEYDLFCHINLLGVINLLKQKQIDLPLYLVCSGWIHENKHELKGLSELNSKQLLNHYENKILLNPDDIRLAKEVWRIYCGNDHNLLKPYIITDSSFIYLSNCLKAHLQRFPNSKSGINELEQNILKIIEQNDIKSKHHLLGYALNYQGYYGFGDIQMQRIINRLAVFYTEEDDKLTLNQYGFKAAYAQNNYIDWMDDKMVFGGAKKHDFYFDTQANKLLKTIKNVD
ncbi:DUF1835 domain-containing protein [Formosa sp. S-31]|uniref:DUF1835 domain-containing protein n=1 Tax=Formosa sp. S-31 TaxID=2790949 RepID=UPI003EBF1846